MSVITFMKPETPTTNVAMLIGSSSVSRSAPTPLVVNTHKHQGNLEDAVPKVSSFQETFGGFAVGNVIPKGTPAVLVVELESALTAVGYAKTAFDIAARERSDLVPLELIAIDDDALDAHAPDSPFSITGKSFCLAFPTASGPHTWGGLLQEHKFEWPGVALSANHPDLDWGFDKLVKRLGRPLISPNKAGRVVLTDVSNSINTSKVGAHGRRKAQPSSVAEPAAGVENKDDDDDEDDDGGSDLDEQGASQAKVTAVHRKKSGPQPTSAITSEHTQPRVTRSKRK